MTGGALAKGRRTIWIAFKSLVDIGIQIDSCLGMTILMMTISRVPAYKSYSQ